MQINERIFVLLNEQGKTASALAAYLGINPASITGWKNEGSYPSSKYVPAISAFLNVSSEYLLTGCDSAFPIPESDKRVLEHYYKADSGIRKAVDKLLDL